MKPRPPHLELRKCIFRYNAPLSRYHITLVGANGETMMYSASYFGRANAIRAIKRIADALGLEWIEEVSV